MSTAEYERLGEIRDELQIISGMLALAWILVGALSAIWLAMNVKVVFPGA